MYSQTVNVAGFSCSGSSSLSASSSSGRVQIPYTGSTLIVRNYGPNRAFISLGDGGVTAATTDYPIEAYTVDYLFRDTSGHTYLAAICANSGESASLSINCGEGGS